MKSEAIYPWFYFFRVARLSLIIFLPTFLLLLGLYRSSYKQGLIEQMDLQLREELQTARLTLTSNKIDPRNWCLSLPTVNEVRYSLVDRRGVIICDTDTSRVGKPVLDLTEVTAAFSDDYASAVRFSDHFATESLFGALRLGDELALRKVVPITSLRDNLGRADRLLFFRVVPFALVSYLLFLFLFYRATKPLGVILSKVEKFKVDIPFNRTLRLLYQQDKWAEIEEALNKADQKLQDQVQQTRTENEKIGAILESISDGIIAVDPFETVLFFNSNFERDFIRGRSLGELVPKLWHVFEGPELLEGFRRVLQEGKSCQIKGLNLLPERFFDLTVTPLKDPGGKTVGALGVFYDVTDFKLTEKMRVDFVANVSHEIRTPLTSIKGYAQVLQSQRQHLPAELAGFLEKIISNTERMISLFNDLLNLSVIESSSELRQDEVDLSELIDEVSSNIRTSYPQKDLRLDLELSLARLRGDPRLLEQVLNNLLDNACKYAGDRIEVKIRSWQDGNRACLAIQDNGPGIPAEHQQRIFERFYRVDASREASRGTGLGLSIVKHIIVRHGGRIWVESRPQAGSTFRIELPLE
jgi:two-component system phosphate regulon sensor histidine kinase PhoR